MCATVQRKSDTQGAKYAQSREFVFGEALVSALHEQFKEPCRSTFFWLLDLMAEVVMCEGVNKMSAKNMAIVVSPNLFGVETDNPMVAVSLAHKVAEFTQVVLKARLKDKFSYEVADGD